MPSVWTDILEKKNLWWLDIFFVKIISFSTKLCADAAERTGERAVLIHRFDADVYLKQVFPKGTFNAMYTAWI